MAIFIYKINIYFSQFTEYFSVLWITPQPEKLPIFQKISNFLSCCFLGQLLVQNNNDNQVTSEVIIMLCYVM